MDNYEANPYWWHQGSPECHFGQHEDCPTRYGYPCECECHEKAQIRKEWSEISRGIAALSDAEFKAFNQRMMERE